MKNYFVIGLYLATSASFNHALAQKPPQPRTINICSTPQNALESAREKYLQVISEGKRKPNEFRPDQCKHETVMSNDVATSPNFKSLGNDPKLNQEHPVAFEVYFTDADCERQCLNKAGGWVSSYELPIQFWPEGNEWNKAIKNRAAMGFFLEQMKAANKVLQRINSYPEKERLARYEESRKSFNEGLKFMQIYGF